MASVPRTFYGRTFNEVGTSDAALSGHLLPLVTGNYLSYTSHDIWHSLDTNSYYHVFKKDSDVYVANLVGEVSAGRLQVKAIYKHKPMTLTRFSVNDDTTLLTEINYYFLLANRTESRPQVPGFRLSKLFDLTGSYVAVYTNDVVDILYSAPANVFLESTSNSQSGSTSSATVPGQITNSAMVPSPIPGPSAVIAVTPQPVVQQIAQPVAQQVAQQIAQPVAQQIDGQIAQQISQQVAQQVAQPGTQPVAQQVAQQIAQQIAQQVAQQVAQSNGGPNRNDGTNGLPVPTFSTSNTALSCAEVTTQYNVSGKDKVECVSSTGATPVSSVTLVLDARQVTLPTVGLEKKDGKWVGFASVGAAQWVWVEITGKKMKYKVQFKSQDWDAKEVEVKDEKDKKFKFEGGTVEYSGQNPFDTGSVVTTVLIVVISIVAAIGILAAVIVAARSRRFRG